MNDPAAPPLDPNSPPPDWPIGYPWPPPNYAPPEPARGGVLPLPPKPAPVHPGGHVSVTLPDDGFVTFCQGDFSLSVDVYEAHCTLNALFEQVCEETPETRPEERTATYLKRVRDYLKELDFPRPSVRTADWFDSALRECVAALGKTDAPAPTPG